MPLSKEKLELLAEKKLLGTITPEEQSLLDDWLKQQPGEQMHWNSGHASERALKERLLTRIKEDAGIGRPSKVIQLRRRMTWVAAAAVIIAMVIGSFLIFQGKPEQSIAVTQTSVIKDIEAPANNRAMITLADGRTIYLDSAGTGSLATVADVQIMKTADGQISYRGTAHEVVYNTLTNPRGSNVIDMTLTDGTRVWLNAGSSLSYPVAFVGDERKVSITGEAYFEVAHNASKPFKVTKGDLEVAVLGTHFNVNAYDDENDIKVTLLEGSVKVSTKYDVRGTLIKPGEQARLVNRGTTVVSGIDVDVVMAWKNGLFKFDGNDVDAVMKQISRWYDVEIVYEGTMPVANFRGTISRRDNISEVLKMLELTKAVKFVIEGKKVIVKK